jgi:hypothetical protein
LRDHVLADEERGELDFVRRLLLRDRDRIVVGMRRIADAAHAKRAAGQEHEHDARLRRELELPLIVALRRLAGLEVRELPQM